MNKKNAMILAMGALLAALIVVIVYTLGGDGSDSDGNDDYISSHEDPTKPRPGRAGKAGGPAPGASTAAIQLERYRKWALYPPHSRPLHAGMVDLIQPYKVTRRAQVVYISGGKGCKRGPDGRVTCETPPRASDIRCALQPESNNSFGTADFRVELRCFRPHDGGEKLLPVEIEKAVMRLRVLGKPRPTLPPIARGDTGTNGDRKAKDLIYTFLIRPTSKDWGALDLTVHLTVEGLKHVIRADWFSTPHQVAEIRGNMHDYRRGGHLWLDVPVNVRKAGYFVFRANLSESEGDKNFIASAEWSGKLKSGAQTIRFQFFGKILRDKNPETPFRVSMIRGRRLNEPVTPDMVLEASRGGKPLPEDVKYTEPQIEFIKPGPEHLTEKYEITDFSAEEWKSADKDNRIKFLRQLVREEH